MQKHRDDLWEAEQKEWAEKRKPIVEKLKPDLDRLEEKREKRTSDWEFVEFIWKEWPPKTEGEFGILYTCKIHRRSYQIARFQGIARF